MPMRRPQIDPISLTFALGCALAPRRRPQHHHVPAQDRDRASAGIASRARDRKVGLAAAEQIEALQLPRSRPHDRTGLPLASNALAPWPAPAFGRRCRQVHRDRSVAGCQSQKQARARPSEATAGSPPRATGRGDCGGGRRRPSLRSDRSARASRFPHRQAGPPVNAAGAVSMPKARTSPAGSGRGDSRDCARGAAAPRACGRPPGQASGSGDARCSRTGRASFCRRHRRSTTFNQ